MNRASHISIALVTIRLMGEEYIEYQHSINIMQGAIETIYTSKGLVYTIYLNADNTAVKKWDYCIINQNTLESYENIDKFLDASINIRAKYSSIKLLTIAFSLEKILTPIDNIVSIDLSLSDYEIKDSDSILSEIKNLHSIMVSLISLVNSCINKKDIYSDPECCILIVDAKDRYYDIEKRFLEIFKFNIPLKF